ncbi:uncharacterized protein [Lepeophtheirus salmonis]
MPVNTSSTGASYGKSSDPLCPLGFHPQVRWPTRCKRCFRDYKEHSDASDRKKYGDLETQKTNSWTLTNTNLRSGFTKSKSLDVSTDIPDWRKRMILRQEHKEIQMRFDIKDQHEEGVPKVSRSQSVQPEKSTEKQQIELCKSTKDQQKIEVVNSNFNLFDSSEKCRIDAALSKKDQTSNINTSNSWVSWKAKNEPTKKNANIELTPSEPSWRKVEKEKSKYSTPQKDIRKINSSVCNTASKEILKHSSKPISESQKTVIISKLTYPQIYSTDSTKPFSQNIEKSKNNELSFQEVQCILPEVNTNYDSKEFESHKALKISEELLKAKAKIREYEICISNYDKDKKSSVIKIKELENELEKRPLQSETQKIISELKTKYSFIEKKCHHLEKENDNLLNNVQNLEGELEEVQDNFREDEADEYRHIKRELEIASKNCRVLQFKLKKVEKFNHDLGKENNILESKIKALSSRDESLSSINDSDKILHLEKELEERNILIKKLESHSSITNFNRRINGPTLNRSGSIESNIEDQLTKDLQDSIERENDLKEHLSMAEEESLQLRKQLSLVEDENESLTSQVKCLSSKAYGNSKKYKQSSSALTRDNERLLDKEESFSKEIKTQMDVKDQENISLRRKVENLINDNHKMAMQLKEFSKHKGSQKQQFTESLSNIHAELINTDLNGTRVTKMDNSKVHLLTSSNSENNKDCALKDQNELLKSQKIKLENKLSNLEEVLKNQKLLNEKKNTQNQSEDEIDQLKSRLDKSFYKANELGKKLNIVTDKADQAQREVITIEREKRRIEDEKIRANTNIAKLELEIRNLKSELNNTKEECDTLKRKNRDNLVQTQDGVKVFKDQISNIKQELIDEQNKVKDTRELFENKVTQLQDELGKLSKSKDESLKKIKDLEEKWCKSKRINLQRKEKIENLEKQLECKKSDNDTMAKILSLEKENDSLRRICETKSSNYEFENLKSKYDDIEKEISMAKEKLQSEMNDLENKYQKLKTEYSAVTTDLENLRASYNMEASIWAKEKMDLQKKLNEIGDKFNNSSSNGWTIERNRFKKIIEDRDAQINQLKIEADVSRSQVVCLKKECDDIKCKLNDYEKMSKFQKVVSNDNSIAEELEFKLNEINKKIVSEQREHKTEINTIVMKYKSKLDIMDEEMSSLKSTCSKYRRERETYKDMLESLENSKSRGTSSIDSEVNEYKSKFNDLTLKMQILEDELNDSKIEALKATAKIISEKSTYEIQIAELNSRINELEECALIESGRARIAGTRTKMELAWQKERDNQKKLINELNAMTRDLKSTLIEMEKERDCERLESKRKIDGMRKAFDSENEDTKKQITDLQYDLLELRDAHAKLRTTNEKLRRDRFKIEKENENLKSVLKEKTRMELDEDKKIESLAKDIEEFLKSMSQLTKKDFKLSRIDTEIAKEEFQSALRRIKESTSELFKIHKVKEVSHKSIVYQKKYEESKRHS